MQKQKAEKTREKIRKQEKIEDKYGKRVAIYSCEIGWN